MGQRANLIIVKKDSYDLYYSHWCANRLPTDMFWGPKHAINFIKMQVKTNIDDWWLDDIWAEGGVIVDIEKKVLLMYGGENILFDIPLRRVYLKLLSQVWKGWQVRWAYEGIVDIADYAGYTRDKVLTKNHDDEHNVTLEPPQEKDWLDTIGSIRFDDNSISIFPLAGFVEGFLDNGSQMIDKVNKAYGYNEFIVENWTTTFPTGGFHIDIVNKSIDFWVAHDIPGLIDRLRDKWDRWQINWQ